MESRVHARYAPARSKRDRMVGAIDLLALGCKLMPEAPAQSTDRLRAMQFRDGLIIALLVARPLRLRNLTGLALDRTVVRRGEEWWITIPPEETKTRLRDDRRAHRNRLRPADQSPPLPRLCGDHHRHRRPGARAHRLANPRSPVDGDDRALLQSGADDRGGATLSTLRHRAAPGHHEERAGLNREPLMRAAICARYWLRRRVVGLLAHLDGRDIPDGARVVVGDPRRLVALEPAEKAGLVLPEVVGARQDAAILRPDDLLVDEGAELLPNALDHRLSAAGVPAVPSGVRQDGVLDGGPDEAPVRLRPLARVVRRWRSFRTNPYSCRASLASTDGWCRRTTPNTVDHLRRESPSDC